jgi:hypothetical protein
VDVPDLGFAVQNVEVIHHAAAPMLGLKLLVTNQDPDEVIHTIVLRCQIQIEVARRTYSAADQERLSDLFGEPERWGQTLRPMLWTHASVVVPRFQGSTSPMLPVPCTFDFNVAATKYFSGLDGGDVPLCLMFSGTVFYGGEDETLRVAPISWDKETRFRLPVGVWKEMMDAYYPNTAWLYLRRDVFDRLYQYKVSHGIPTWEEAFEKLVAAHEEKVLA